MNLVIDTNVFVSGLMSPGRTAAGLMLLMVEARFTPVVSRVVFDEYRVVLQRQKFNFPPAAVETLFETLANQGLWLNPPTSNRVLPDPSDRPFIDLAGFAACPVVTGNARHFPASTGVEILSPAECIERVLKA